MAVLASTSQLFQRHIDTIGNSNLPSRIKSEDAKKLESQASAINDSLPDNSDSATQ
jgi:hypothetical protein